jgi:hypothetical protein
VDHWDLLRTNERQSARVGNIIRGQLRMRLIEQYSP